MTDEISIYISPEDDVTTVRERLEKTSHRQVTMVIPAQTQLRSLVAWRVLHADARRMGKDVLVVSTDPQIRSLAQAGKFRVAHSQASSITSSKSRPPTRPGRTGGAGKSKLTASQARMQAAKKPSMQLPPETPAESVSSTRPAGHSPRNSDTLNQRYSPLPAGSSALRDTGHPFGGTTTGNLKGKSSTFSPSFGEPTQESGQFYDTHVDTAPAVHQVPSHLPEEESTTYWADNVDYKKAEDIRNSAQYSDINVSPPIVHLPSKTPQETSRSDEHANDAIYGGVYKTTPLPQQPGESIKPSPDLYQVMDDHIPQSLLAEQHGSASINGLDTSEYAIHNGNVEASAEVIGGSLQVEDLGDDRGTNINTFDIPPITTEDVPHHSWSEPLRQEQQESAGPSHIYKAHGPRSSRRENRENIPPSPRHQDLDDPLDLPPIDERPTVIIPPQELSPVSPSGIRPSGKIAASTDVPKTPAANKKTTTKRASQQILGSSSRTPTTARPKTNVPARAAAHAGTRRPNVGVAGRRGVATKKLAEQSSRRSGAVLLLLVILLLLLIGIPAFFVPTADVTLKLPSKDYTHAVTLKAVPSGQQGSVTDTVPADQLTNDFEETRAGKATGSAQVGTAPATGTVTFTNNGTVLVTIPSGTIVTTSNGTAFSTQAEAVVNTASSNIGSAIQVPVQAQKPGTSGNVLAGSISSIPPDSLNAIVLYNKMNASDLKLMVTNEQATVSGGVGTAPAISQQDIDAAKAALHTSLNNKFHAWLAQKVTPGDQTGTLTTSETLENAPTVNQTTTDGTFTAKLKLSVTVLIVRAATLQRASIAQLNQSMKKDKAFMGYAVVDDAKHPVQVQQPKTKSDGRSTLTLTFTAASKVVQDINVQYVQSLIDGKSINDARSILQSIQGVQHVDISTAPNIGGRSPSWMPFWSGHITIHLVPEDSVTVPKKK
ncbi:MAG: hypothetical protein NVS4B11_11000 [Ktedonobacteraceae bacterium]